MKLPMITRFLLICFLLCAVVYGKTSHAIILVMDGARYTETLGDSTHANIPKIASLAKKGMVFTNFVTATVGMSEGGRCGHAYSRANRHCADHSRDDGVFHADRDGQIHL